MKRKMNSLIQKMKKREKTAYKIAKTSSNLFLGNKSAPNFDPNSSKLQASHINVSADDVLQLGNSINSDDGLIV